MQPLGLFVMGEHVPLTPGRERGEGQRAVGERPARLVPALGDEPGALGDLARRARVGRWRSTTRCHSSRARRGVASVGSSARRARISALFPLAAACGSSRVIRPGLHPQVRDPDGSPC